MTLKFYIRSELTTPEDFRGDRFEFSVFSRSGHDGPNEDCAAFAEVEGGVVLVVADGAGGIRRGGEASEQAVLAMTAALEDSGRLLRDRVLSGFEEANRRVLALGSATTLVVAECAHGAVRFYNAGDSAALQTGQRGKIKQYTVAHSPVGYAVEAGMMTEAEAFQHDDRHLVSNMLGSPEMRIEIGVPKPMAPRDTIVLGSDGLFDNMTTPEIVDAVRRGALSVAARQLMTQSLARMAGALEGPSKPDDLTYFVARALPQNA